MSNEPATVQVALDDLREVLKLLPYDAWFDDHGATVRLADAANAASNAITNLT